MASMKEIVNNQALVSTVLSFDSPDLKIYFSPKGLGYAPWKQPVVLHENGDVELNAYFPHAQKVEIPCLTGGRLIDGKRVDDFRPYHDKGLERMPMTAVGDGWWHLYVPDANPGYYYFKYWVDDVETVYDRGMVTYVAMGATNALDIPDHEDDCWFLCDVPHGAVRQEIFFSEVTGRHRNCFVYTPPAYDTSPDKQYPVLFVQHGGGQNETSWFWEGKLNYIMDNLIADGQIPEMLVVCNTGYAFTDEDDTTEVYKPLMPGRFWDMLVKDCIPFLESRFRIKPGKENRAICGVSMGSLHAQITAYMYPEYFDYVGVFGMNVVVESGGKLLPEGYLDITNDAERFNQTFKLVFYGIGEEEAQIPELERQLRIARDRGLKIESFFTRGDHEWRAVRMIVKEFILRLFRD